MEFEDDGTLHDFAVVCLPSMKVVVCAFKPCGLNMYRHVTILSEAQKQVSHFRHFLSLF